MQRTPLERLNEFASELVKTGQNGRYAAALGKLIGCSQSVAWRLLNGERLPSLRLAAAIERATKRWRGGQIRASEWVPDQAVAS